MFLSKIFVFSLAGLKRASLCPCTQDKDFAYLQHEKFHISTRDPDNRLIKVIPASDLDTSWMPPRRDVLDMGETQDSLWRL